MPAAALAVALASWPLAARSGPDAQRLRPSPAVGDAGLATPTARPAWDLPWQVGALLDHADNPVLLRSTGAEPVPIVDSQTTLHLLAAWAPFTHLSLGLEVPLVLRQSGSTPVDRAVAASSAKLPGVRGGDAPFGLGDVRATLGVTALTTETPAAPRGLSVGGQVEIFAPTGDGAHYQGEGFRTELRGVADLALAANFAVGGALGYRFRSADRLRNVAVDDEITYAAGAHVGLGRRVALMPELAGAVEVLDGAPEREEAPLEALLTVDVRAVAGLHVLAGGGAGIVGGFGVPRVRGLLGLAWREGSPIGGRHISMLSGAVAVDQCADAEEDLDGFQDEDGCPDLDDDADGVPDAADDCRLRPEDVDGFEDTDGCPDPDDDRDGLPDAADRCPREAEDRDGIDDGDGCPEGDDDADAVRDRDDLCPAAPEARNGFRDEDGCPDERPVEIDCKGFTLGGDVLFESGEAALLPSSLPLLDRLARTLTDLPELRRIRLYGYTDDLGPERLNLDLSQRRVDEVRRHLLSQGVAAARLEAIGRGEADPAVPNTSPANRARNRRVEFVVVERDGCPPASP